MFIIGIILSVMVVLDDLADFKGWTLSVFIWQFNFYFFIIIFICLFCWEIFHGILDSTANVSLQALYFFINNPRKSWRAVGKIILLIYILDLWRVSLIVLSLWLLLKSRKIWLCNKFCHLRLFDLFLLGIFLDNKLNFIFLLLLFRVVWKAEVSCVVGAHNDLHLTDLPLSQLILLLNLQFLIRSLWRGLLFFFNLLDLIVLFSLLHTIIFLFAA